MKQTYMDIKNASQKELNNFPMFFAFNNKQFYEGIEKLGVKDYKKELLKIPGGGFIRKVDGGKLAQMFKDQSNRLSKAIKDREFLISALKYEMMNHECFYSYNFEPVINIFNLDLDNNKLHKECFATAKIALQQENDI